MVFDATYDNPFVFVKLNTWPRDFLHLAICGLAQTHAMEFGANYHWQLLQRQKEQTDHRIGRLQSGTDLSMYHP